MSGNAIQSRYEKLVAALLVIGVAAVGWGPFALSAMSLPYIDRFLVPMTLAMAVMALGVTYDAVERLLGRGRGIYAAAIFCSFPATGFVATTPGALPTAALLLVISVGLWMASRAQGDDRPFFLGMLGVLMIVAGYFFRLEMTAIPLAFVAWLAGRQGKHLRLVSVGLILLYIGGGVAGNLLRFELPMTHVIPPPVIPAYWKDVVLWLPWTWWVLGAIGTAFRKPNALTWQRRCGNCFTDCCIIRGLWRV